MNYVSSVSYGDQVKVKLAAIKATKKLNVSKLFAEFVMNYPIEEPKVETSETSHVV